MKKWPDDTHKIYSSFRNAQLKLYEGDKPSDLPSAETLELRTQAAGRLLDNVHFNAFRPNDRVHHPDGNPLYYDLIRREANAERRRVGVFTGIKHTLFGWWKK